MNLNVYSKTYKKFSPLNPEKLKSKTGKQKIINRNIFIFKLLKIKLIINKIKAHQIILIKTAE